MGITLKDRLMGWLGYSRSGSREVWHEVPIYNSWSGMVFTPEQALRVNTVMACVKVIAEDIASLPLNVYRLLEKGGKEIDRNHRLSYLLHNAPNSWQTSVEFREVMQGHLLLRGNAIARIIPDERGFPEALEPQHPDLVRIERDINTKKLVYYIKDPVSLKETPYMQDDIFHIRNFSLDGVKGLSPIGYASESVGVSLSADQYESGFYRNGTHVGLHLQHPSVMSPESKKELKRQLKEGFEGSANSFKALITEDDMKVNKLGITNHDAQFMESKKLRTQDICRIFKVPSYKVNDHEHSKYNNVEQLQIDYVTSCLRSWIVRWEQAIERDLFMRDENYTAKFVIEGLLRGDVKTRTEALSMQKDRGVLSCNEWREIEDRNPVDGGDELTDAANLMGNRGGSDNQPKDNDSDNEALSGWVSDISGRLCRAEERAVSRWIESKDTEDNWPNWCKELYFNEFGKYIKTTLQPLVKTQKTLQFLEIKITEKGWIYEKMTSSAVLQDINSSREREIFEIIYNEVKNGQ